MPSYEAELSRFEGANTHVLGISVDSVPCNAAWAKSLGGISYDLLSDFEPKGEVARKYGAYRAPDGFSERALFVLDGDGVIRWSYLSDVATNPGADGVLAALEEMSQPAGAGAP